MYKNYNSLKSNWNLSFLDNGVYSGCKEKNTEKVVFFILSSIIEKMNLGYSEGYFFRYDRENKTLKHVNSYFNLKKLTKEEIEFLLVNLEKKIKFKGTSLEKYIKNKDIQINIPKLEDGQKLNLLSRFENFMMIPVYYENMYYGFFILGGNKSKVRELTEEEYKTLETCRDKFAYYLYSREKEISKDEKLRVKTISSFVNSITHELRTPVSSIIGFASLAKKKKEDFQKVELYLEHIIQEADKIIKLTEDIGIYSESTQKLSKKEKEKFLISQAIKDSLKKMERQLKQANIKTYLIIEEDIEINFYKEKVVTAFGNLIKNAMENCDYSKG
jgi:K+-sensing histidine kinase KdpD